MLLARTPLLQALLPAAAPQVALLRGKGWWALAFLGTLLLNSATYQVRRGANGHQPCSWSRRLRGWLVGQPRCAAGCTCSNVPPSSAPPQIVLQLWWIRGIANPNFLYGMNLAWGACQALLSVQLVKQTAQLEAVELRQPRAQQQ